MKKIFFWCILILIPVVVVLLAELAGAIYTYSRGRKVYQFDNKIGWIPRANFNYNKLHSDIAGNTYRVKLSTNKYGFRAWGDTSSDKTKILFIGDSYTGDPNMSDEDSYFGQVSKLTGTEVFAIGGGGYGTLQELMLFLKYKDMIKPDYFVLQFCTNDYTNNSFYLEGRSIVRNQKNFRPYLKNNEIIYRLYQNHWFKILYKNSHIFRFLDRKLQQAQFNQYNNYSPPPGADKERIEQEEVKAKEITERLLVMMAKSAPPGTKLITFSCSTDHDRKTERWIRMAKKAGFIPLPAISRAVEEAEKNGTIVRAADGGHWNPTGHRIAGNALAKELVRLMAEKPR